MTDEPATRDRDLRTLAGIVKGPGYYPTPSPDRIKRLVDGGLVRQVRGILRPTLKGLAVALLRRFGLLR